MISDRTEHSGHATILKFIIESGEYKMIKKRLLVVAAAASFTLPAFIPQNVSAQSNRIEELKKEQDELNNQNSQLDEQINEKEAQMNSLKEERTNLEKEVSGLQKNIDELILNIQEQEKEIERIEKEIKKLQEEITRLEKIIEERNEQLESQARSVQTEGNTTDMIEMILSAENLSDLVGRIGVVSKIVSANQDIMQAQIDDQNALEVAEKSIQNERESVTSAKAQLEVDRNNLVAQRMELDDKIVQVAEKFNMSEKDKASFVNEQAVIAQRTSTLSEEMQKEQQRIMEEQKRIQEEQRLAEEKRQREEAEAAARAEAAAKVETSSSKSNSSSTNTKPSNNASASRPAQSNSSWTRPARGRRTSTYGMRKHPLTGKSKLHSGIDIAGGGPIVAARAGKVVQATYSGGFGYTVLIDHGDGYSSRYAHMKAGLSVAPGQTVSQGQQLGIMGTTGTSTGVHLHFEILKGGSTVDPLPYIGG